jgi:hypothetical protein
MSAREREVPDIPGGSGTGTAQVFDTSIGTAGRFSLVMVFISSVPVYFAPTQNYDYPGRCRLASLFPALAVLNGLGTNSACTLGLFEVQLFVH